MNPFSALPFFVCCFLASILANARAAGALLPGAERILFLGDSITHAGHYVEFIETYFVTRFPERPLEFLNLGLPSETVSGLSENGHADGKFPRPNLHERLTRVLQKVRPDLVIACYGMNDGIYLPYSDERFSAFSNGLVRLREQVTASGAKLICLTPPIFDEKKGRGPGYGNTLDRYSDWLVGRRAQKWDVVDVHQTLDRFLQERRRQDPGFFLAGDGVHLGEQGHWLLAKYFLIDRGAKDLTEVKNAGEMARAHPNGEAMQKLVQQKQRLLRDAWLTETGHERPGMSKGLPLEEAKRKAVDLEKQIRMLARP